MKHFLQSLRKTSTFNNRSDNFYEVNTKQSNNKYKYASPKLPPHKNDNPLGTSFGEKRI